MTKKASGSSSRMMAARMSSCTSALSNIGSVIRPHFRRQVEVGAKEGRTKLGDKLRSPCAARWWRHGYSGRRQIPTPNIFLNKDRLAFDYCTCLVTLIKMSVGGQYGGIVLPFSGTMASDNTSGHVAQRLRVATARSGTRHDRLRAE